MKNFSDYDWFCDGCNAKLNDQKGFTGEEGNWTCTVCGYVNSICDDSIISFDEYDEFKASDYDSYHDYQTYGYNSNMHSGDDLSLSDACYIWLSNGKDEDYMFGYTEEELEEEAKR